MKQYCEDPNCNCLSHCGSVLKSESRVYTKGLWVSSGIYCEEKNCACKEHEDWNQ